MSELKKQFGKRLKYLRKIQNISQEQFAEMIGITPRNLSKIETGQTFPSVDTLEKMSKKLDCNYSILFDFENLNDILSLRNSAIRNINKLNNENLIKISKILDILIY